MKIIHCADLHLGSRLTSLPSGEVRDQIKNEVREGLHSIVKYAKDNDIKIILFSGDVFDSNRPSLKDKSYFYDIVKSNPDITFYYLKGNHDIEESLTEEIDNLKTFNEEWTYYKNENIVISGIELSNNNRSSLYSTLSLNSEDINIVMMHGDLSSKGKDFIDLKKLSNKNIDYLALGHIHKYSEMKVDNRGKAVYSGCLVGRGFDELGEKGFVVLNIENNNITQTFVPIKSQLFLEKDIDLSKVKNLVETRDFVEDETKDIDKSSLLKIILKGKVDFPIADIDKDIERSLSKNFFFLKVYSEIKRKIDVDEYKKVLSLKGEFVRNVESNSDLSEEEKEEILDLGFKILNGEEF